MGERRVDYVPELDVSFVDNGDGTAQSIQGDHTNNPMYFSGEQKSGPRLKPTPSSASKIAQSGKDAVVNLASQIPMAIPGLGLVPRAGLSLLSGLVGDQVMNPDNDIPESLGEAGLNTLIGGVLEGIAGGTIKPKLPSPRMGVAGSGRFGRAWLSLHGLSPLYRDPDAIAPGSNMLDLLKAIPAPATRGPKGQFLKQAQLMLNKQNYSAAQKKVIIDSITNLMKYNIAPGMAGNELFDVTLNSKQ